MEKEFIPYEQALALKELGFDEPCFNAYDEYGKFIYFNKFKKIQNSEIIKINSLNPTIEICSAPLYQQAFRWFREKHNLRSFIDTRVYDVDSPNQWIYDFQIKMGNGVDTQPFYSGDFDTYEEARLETLIKLIEYVEKQQTNIQQ